MGEPHYEIVYVDGHDVWIHQQDNGMISASCSCGQMTISDNLIAAEQSIHRLHEKQKARKNEKVFYALRYPKSHGDNVFVGFGQGGEGYPYATELFHEIHMWKTREEADNYRISFERLLLERVKITLSIEDDE